jgi:serine phosphatase RsbU (regulator of sigma subunit)
MLLRRSSGPHGAAAERDTPPRHTAPLLSRLAAGVLLALVVVSIGGAWATHVVVDDQESRLLAERAAEVHLVISESISEVPASLTAISDAMRTASDSDVAFGRVASIEAAAQPGVVTYALLKAVPAGSFVVVAARGPALHRGEIVGGVRAATMEAATRTATMVATPVVGSGADRVLGFALGAPAAPAGTVLYRQDLLGRLTAPRTADTAPFHEVQIALYATPSVDGAQILLATTHRLPLRGSVAFETVPAGTRRWLLAVRATQPLVGSVAADAPWVVLAAGLVGSLLAAAVVEAEARRRRVTLALFDGEHQLAEKLQRSLLPELPELPGIELAARYVAGVAGQQVGGDWFDVFRVGDDSTGVVIGDVIGHDVAAAAAMSQVRAMLRAYASEGADPAVVLDRLDRLVRDFDVADLVTVFYGVLGPPGADGARLFRYANAGHPPPLLWTAAGGVVSLLSETSMILGVSELGTRSDHDVLVHPSAILLLYTDGLIEVPGTSLDGAIEQLSSQLGASAAGDPLDSLCRGLVDTSKKEPAHDDVAVLAVRILAAPRPVAGGSSTRGAGWAYGHGTNGGDGPDREVGGVVVEGAGWDGPGSNDHCLRSPGPDDAPRQPRRDGGACDRQ